MQLRAGKGVTSRPVVRLGKAGDDEDAVVVEEPLEIRVAGDTVAVTMRTPGDDRFLALGFLFAEGIVESADDVVKVSHCGHLGEEGYGNTIDVIPAAAARVDLDRLFERVAVSRRGTLTTAACGVCGRKTVDDVIERCPVLPPGPVVSAAWIAGAVAGLRQRQPIFAATGGIHAAAAVAADGQVLACFEDIGRHNAIDKVVGKLLTDGWLEPAGPRRPDPREAARPPVLLVVSGRASFEVAQKAAQARLPIVASVSAPSSLAVDLATALGLTLCGFVRGNSMTLYSTPDRITPT